MIVSGKLIANVPVSQHSGVAPIKGHYNFHFQESVTVVCTGNSETPGKGQIFVWGFLTSIDPDSGETTLEIAFAIPK